MMRWRGCGRGWEGRSGGKRGGGFRGLSVKDKRRVWWEGGL